MNEQPHPDYIVATISALGSIAVAVIGGVVLIKVTQLKTHINSRMDELLTLTAKSARAKGVIEGITKKRAEAALTAKGSVEKKKLQSARKYE